MWKRLCAGIISGCVGSFATQPIELLKTRVQGAPAGAWQPMREHALTVYKQGGVPGFYSAL